jgi:hypothetical protein
VINLRYYHDICWKDWGKLREISQDGLSLGHLNWDLPIMEHGWFLLGRVIRLRSHSSAEAIIVSEEHATSIFRAAYSKVFLRNLGKSCTAREARNNSRFVDDRRSRVKYWENKDTLFSGRKASLKNCLNSRSGGWSPNWDHSARRPLVGLLYLPRVIVRMKNLVEWRLAGKTEILGEHLPQRHFVHHKSHFIRPGLEPGPQRWEAGD